MFTVTGMDANEGVRKSVFATFEADGEWEHVALEGDFSLISCELMSNVFTRETLREVLVFLRESEIPEIQVHAVVTGPALSQEDVDELIRKELLSSLDEHEISLIRGT